MSDVPQNVFDRLINNINSIAPEQEEVSGFTSCFPGYSPSPFLQVPHSRTDGACIPQKRYKKGAGRSAAQNKGLLVFALEGESYIPVTAALGGNYSGLIGRDARVLEEVGLTITLRFEVRGSHILGDKLILNGCAVAGLSL